MADEAEDPAIDGRLIFVFATELVEEEKEESLCMVKSKLSVLTAKTPVGLLLSPANPKSFSISLISNGL
jgi:hypothetical protein